MADLQLLAAGIESVLRNDLAFYYHTTSIVGREYWDLTATDPRYTGELLGKNSEPLDANGFLTTRAFAQVYRVVRNANNFITATINSQAGLSLAEIDALIGFAETIKAYSLMLELNRQYNNGIRIDVSDPENLGPFIEPYGPAIAAVQSLLNDANSKLTGASFPIVLSSGFSGFDTPTTFKEFNRALAARAALYAGDLGAAGTALSASFMNIGAPMGEGVYHIFGSTGNDITNPLVVIPNQDNYIIHPTVITDAEPNDSRVAAFSNQLASPVTTDGLTGDFQNVLFSSMTASIPMITNGELLLIWAEANIGTNNGNAVNAINAVRNAAGIGNYGGAVTNNALLDEVLHQRRYELFGLGHRWVDLRRLNRLADIPIDRTGDIVHAQFPRPTTEID